MTQEQGVRIDKWLWHARFYKTRSLCAQAVQSRRVRVNGTVITKQSRLVYPNDTLTLRYHDAVLVLRINSIGTRRGPATEARALYSPLLPKD